MKMPDTTKAASSTHRTGQIVPATVPKVNRLALARTTGHAASTGYTDNVDNVDNFSGLALAACTPMQARGTIATDAQKHHRLGRPIIEGAVAAPVLDSGFFTSMCCAWHTRLSVLVGCVGTSARVCRFLRPVGQPRTVCHPCLAAGAAGFKPVSKEPLVANTLTPKGRIAPTSKATPAISPTEAQAHASLAGFYLRKGNIAQARRKLRQALQALNALEVAHA